MSLRLLGNEFVVEIVNRDDTRLQGSMGKVFLGHQLILLADVQSRDQLRSTVLHEILESCNMMMNLDLGEHQIACLETALYAVLSDNGVSLESLVARMKEEPSGHPG